MRHPIQAFVSSELGQKYLYSKARRWDSIQICEDFMNKPRTKLTNNVTISDTEVAKYDQDGYLVVENVMNPYECDLLQRLAQPFADDNYSVVLNIHRQSEIFLDVMRDSVVANIARKIQRSEVDGLNSQFLFKRKGSTYGKQSWTPHQDNAYPRAVSGAYLIIHLSLEHSDASNGGLIFWPGSHVEDLLPFEDNKSWKEEVGADGISRPGKTCAVPEKYVKTDMHLPKGSLCFMHGHLIHASYPNLSPHRSRPQFSFAYMNKGADYVQGVNSVKERFDVD